MASTAHFRVCKKFRVRREIAGGEAPSGGEFAEKGNGGNLGEIGPEERPKKIKEKGLK